MIHEQIYFAIMFGTGIIGFILNMTEAIIKRDFKDWSFGGILFFLMLCIWPLVGWIITGVTIARQLNYIFKFAPKWLEDYNIKRIIENK